jgi:hypothetical protein
MRGLDPTVFLGFATTATAPVGTITVIEDDDGLGPDEQEIVMMTDLSAKLRPPPPTSDKSDAVQVDQQQYDFELCATCNRRRIERMKKRLPSSPRKVNSDDNLATSLGQATCNCKQSNDF